MNDIIFLTYDVFAMQSRICVIKNGNPEYHYVPSTVHSVSEAIANLAHQNDIYHVAADAPEDFAKELCLKIAESEQKLYSAHKIHIEVV